MIKTLISHDEDDTLENSDGHVYAIGGVSLGCLECHADVETRWSQDSFYGPQLLECRECLTVLAEE